MGTTLHDFRTLSLILKVLAHVVHSMFALNCSIWQIPSYLYNVSLTIQFTIRLSCKVLQIPI